MLSLNIFLDTNVVKNHNTDLTKFELNETYRVLKNFIIENEVENVKVLIPRIVIEELISQYIAEYKETVNHLNSEITKLKISADKVQWDININKNFEKSFRDYIEFIKNKVQIFIEEEKDFLEVVEFPGEGKLFKIIERSLKKKKPFFSGKHQKKDFSDAGFKDVIFLESIIEYLENKEVEYLIITRDNFFKEINYNEEILGVNGSLLDKETGKELVSFLSEKLGVEDLTAYRKFAKSAYYKEAIETALNCDIIGDPISVNKFEDDDLVIIEICNSVQLYQENIRVIVRLSEENEFIEILNEGKEEVMHEWMY